MFLYLEFAFALKGFVYVCECSSQLNLFASLQQCRKACKLPFPEVRCLVKTLKKKHLVQEVHQDVAKQRVAWWDSLYGIV